MIRAFIGVAIDPSVAGRIADAQAELARSLPAVRWVGRESLHLTLKFLGSIEEARGEPIVTALEQALGRFSAFPVLARGLGVFPDIRRAKTLWIGLESAKLKAMAMEVDAALEAIDFVREEREFKPHLTIGRWRGSAGLPEPLRGELARWKEHEFGGFRVSEAVFFQSILKAEGALYRPLKVVPLGAS